MENIYNKVLIIGINLGDYGSTGNIMINTLELAKKEGFDVIACVATRKKSFCSFPIISFSTKLSFFDKLLFKLVKKICPFVNNEGNHFRKQTKNLIKIIESKSRYYTNVIVHLHNLHHANLDINYFYKYLAKCTFKIFYSMHDCWPITGGCYYYDFVNCTNWQHDCKNCPQKIINSNYQLDKRTKLLSKIKNLTFLPVSKWADSQLKMSKLKGVPSIVVYGETSLEPYHFDESLFKKQNGLLEKKILLFVGAYWNNWKGVRYIYELADIIPKNYIIIVIGRFDIKNYKNIIQIDTLEQEELVKYYTIADVYVSVTQSEQLGLTTCEAQLCGTPVVGFGNGGSKETFIDGVTGILVENKNLRGLLEAINKIIANRPFKKEDIVMFGKKFQKYECAKKTVLLYKKLF